MGAKSKSGVSRVNPSTEFQRFGGRVIDGTANGSEQVELVCLHAKTSQCSQRRRALLVKPLHFAACAPAIKARDEQHVAMQLGNVEDTQAESARNRHIGRFVAQYFTVRIGTSTRTLDDVVSPRALVRQGRVRIPAAINGLGQQVFGGNALYAGPPRCEQRMHHHGFVKIRGAKVIE
jgi:hypothetical protein